MGKMGMEKRLARLADKIGPPDENGCRHWLGRHNNRGYGVFKYDGVGTSAHRYVWLLLVGPIPPGLVVCHTCDVRDCVALEHLWLGTYKQNTQDAVAKGRMHQGERTGPSKLTEAQVLEIRSKYVPRGHPNTYDLAREYGIGQHAVYAIVSGQTWRHLLPPQ